MPFSGYSCRMIGPLSAATVFCSHGQRVSRALPEDRAGTDGALCGMPGTPTMTAPLPNRFSHGSSGMHCAHHAVEGCLFRSSIFTGPAASGAEYHVLQPAHFHSRTGSRASAKWRKRSHGNRPASVWDDEWVFSVKAAPFDGRAVLLAHGSSRIAGRHCHRLLKGEGSDGLADGSLSRFSRRLLHGGHRDGSDPQQKRPRPIAGGACLRLRRCDLWRGARPVKSGNHRASLGYRHSGRGASRRGRPHPPGRTAGRGTVGRRVATFRRGLGRTVHSRRHRLTGVEAPEQGAGKQRDRNPGVGVATVSWEANPAEEPRGGVCGRPRNREVQVGGAPARITIREGSLRMRAARDVHRLG
jgi:hypothetical protein